MQRDSISLQTMLFYLLGGVIPLPNPLYLCPQKGSLFLTTLTTPLNIVDNAFNCYIYIGLASYIIEGKMLMHLVIAIIFSKYSRLPNNCPLLIINFLNFSNLHLFSNPPFIKLRESEISSQRISSLQCPNK